MTFRGFAPEAFEFYEQLTSDNSKAFWQANRATYDTSVRGALAELCDDLAEFGPFHLFRPYNDVRFAKNRPPYKTAQGAYGEREGGSGCYLQLSAEGLMAGGGCYMMRPDQLTRFRAAVDAEAAGTALVSIEVDLTAAGFTVGAREALKTAPRGFAKDHPRIELLRRKGTYASRTWPVDRWMHTANAADRIVET